MDTLVTGLARLSDATIARYPRLQLARVYRLIKQGEMDAARTSYDAMQRSADRASLPADLRTEIDLVGERAGAAHQLDGCRLLEPEHHVGRLDLDALARVELDLHRGVGLVHHAAGVKLAGVVEEGIGHVSGARPPEAIDAPPWGAASEASLGAS